MANLVNLLVSSWPSNGMWEAIIGWFYSFIQNYAITIIIFTIALKLVMFPLDFFQKRTTQKNAEMNAKIQPKMQELQKRYGQNKEMYNQKVMELYKKENYSVAGSCVSMLVTFVLTIVIFMTLWSALGRVSAHKIVWQYEQLNSAYVQVINDPETALLNEEAKSAKITETLKQEYEKNKDSFLWIENIWQPDTNTSPILSYNQFKKMANQYRVAYLQEGQTEEEFKEQYEIVTNSLKVEYNRWNGYFVLVALSAIITYLSQQLLTKLTNPKTDKSKDDPTQQQTAAAGKVMGVVMPLIMIWFTWSSSAAFAIYIIINSVVGIASSFATTAIYKAIKKHKENKEVATGNYKR